jgi:light-harvesting complex I chlorophyll a/b binding protein 1
MLFQGAVLSIFLHACSAFVHQGNLRTLPSVEVLPQSVVIERIEEPKEDFNASTSAAVIGLAAMGLACGAARIMAKKHAPTSRIARCAEPGTGVVDMNNMCNEVGVCMPLASKWDPLDLGSTDAKMARYTTVEVKHARISMIACIGYMMPEVFRFPGCEKFENGLAAFTSIPIEGWIQLIAFVGAHEILVKPREGGYGDYDFGLGVEYLEEVDPMIIRWRLTKERNNGRLAMMAIMGLLVQDGLFGNPLQYDYKNGFWGESTNIFVKDIPICTYPTTLCGHKQTPSRVGCTARHVAVYEYKSPFGEPPETKMSPAMPFLPYPANLEGWVGGEKGFDPLGISNEFPVYFLREAELKHGRICMLATVGWIATDSGIRLSSAFEPYTTLNAHNMTLNYLAQLLGIVFTIEVFNIWQLEQGVRGEITREAGDFFLGKNFLPKEPEKEREMRLKELENGRLAMLAFSGMVTAGHLTQKTIPFF